MNADLLSVIHEEVESIEEEKKEEISVIRRENFPVIRPSTDILENPFYEN